MYVSPRLPWYCLLSAVILVPLAVGIVPISGVPLTLNAFVQAKLIVLAATVGIGLGAWSLTKLASREVYLGRALIPVGVFLAAAVLSAAFAADPRLAFFGDAEQGVGLLVMILCSLALLLTTQLVRNGSDLKTLTDAVIYTGTAVAAVGLLQQVFYFDLLGIGSRLAEEFIIQRGYGTIGNADSYAAYLLVPAILALTRLASADETRTRVIWGACFAAMGASLVMSQTRAPLVALVVTAALFGIVTLIRRRLGGASAGTAREGGRIAAIAIVVTVAAAVAAALSLATATDIAARFSPQSLLALGGRLPLWRSAVDVFAAHPVLGVGPDSFRLGWYGVRPVSHLSAGTGLVITDPHSVPLLIGATMGVVGLLAAAALVLYPLAVAARTVVDPQAAQGARSDYNGWFYATVAMSVALLASMLTSALLFMLFIALGVLVAPALVKAEQVGQPAIRVAQAAGGVLAAGLVVFAVMSLASQITAVGSRVDDPELARVRAARAAALAPWDTGLRNLRFETQVQEALASVFAGDTRAPQLVTEAADDLGAAADAVPQEYLFPYQSTVLLVGSGQRLGEQYTARGMEAGQRGLGIYPNSLELRTGLANGHLQLGQPQSAEELLQSVWDADPQYLPAGLAYAEALIAQEKLDEARSALSELKERFPDNAALADLDDRLDETTGE